MADEENPLAGFPADRGFKVENPLFIIAFDQTFRSRMALPALTDVF